MSAVEAAYPAIQMASADAEQKLPVQEEYDPFTSPIWAFNPTNYYDLLDMVWPSDEAILEA